MKTVPSISMCPPGASRQAKYYCMSKKSCPYLLGELFRNEQDFLDTQFVNLFCQCVLWEHIDHGNYIRW